MQMLASIVDNLQQGKLSPLTLMQRAQKLPLRYRYLTDKVIKARRNGDFRFKEISLGESTFKKGSSHSLGNGNECRGYISLTGPMQKEPNEDSAQMKELLQQRYRLKRFGGHDRLMQQKFHQQHYRIERPGDTYLQQQQEQLPPRQAAIPHVLPQQQQQQQQQQNYSGQHHFARRTPSPDQLLPCFEPSPSRKLGYC